MTVEYDNLNVAAQASSDQLPNGWLTSFADLLTLLLCFFISIFALSSVNPNIPAVTKQDNNEFDTAQGAVKPLAGSNVLRIAAGTDLAVDKVDVEHAFAWSFSQEEFLASDYDLTRLRLQGKASSRLRKALLSGGYALSKAKISACESEQLVLDGGAEVDLVVRTLPIYRQLIDMGVSPGFIAVEMVSGCSRLALNDQDTVARVDFAFRRNS